MTTAQGIITPALEKAGIIPIGQDPGPAINSRVLIMLNDMIASWKSEGLDLQIDALTATGTVYLDASDIMALKYNLAVLVSEEYRMPIPATTAMRATKLFDKLVGKYLEAGLEVMELPPEFQS